MRSTRLIIGPVAMASFVAVATLFFVATNSFAEGKGFQATATLSPPTNDTEVAEETATEKPVDSAALKRVTDDIKYLASDELGGRKPGTEGIEVAAKYIEAEYKRIGLKPLENGTYRQDFEVRQGLKLDKEATSLKLTNGDDTRELELGVDYMPQASRRKFEFDTDLVFVGYGINAEDDYNYNDYRDADVEDKIVVLIRREPQQNDPNSVFVGGEGSDGTAVSKYSYIQTKVRAARDAGAAGIIMVNDGASATDDEKDVLEDTNRFSAIMPFIQVKRRVIDDLLKKTPLTKADGRKLSSLSAIEELIDETLSPVSQPLGGWKIDVASAGKQNMAKTSNVVGVIEGEGPHADETIVIGGHYDHLGMGGFGSRVNRREVHNGADDNATGTAAVMELARRYAQREQKPARRLLFICFSAEEMGLLGAYHYVKEPIFSLENTSAMVNFDMIGWLRDDKVTVYNANSAQEFSSLLDRANESFNMDIAKSAGFGGSDHLPFFQKEIPVMFIHTGLTSTYHTPEDDFETIDCAGALKVIDYSERVIDEIISLKTKATFQSASAARRNRVRLGVSLEDDDQNGVEITRVLEGSLAEQHDFRVGDFIKAIGVDQTEKRRQVNRIIRANPGKTMMFKLKRGEENLEKLVELKVPDDE